MVGLVEGPEITPTDAREFSKICKAFFKKMVKMHYFSIFTKSLKPCVFRRFGRENINCSETLREA